MIIDDSLPLYLLGDNHGQYEKLFRIIKQHNLRDCNIVHVGDGGEGFCSRHKQLRQFNYLNNFFKTRNIYYRSIRGNHSDPYYFCGEGKVTLSNFELITDYTRSTYKHKSILFLGGATSIDRIDRKVGSSYWVDECVQFDPNKCVNVDILITHTAPSNCWIDGIKNIRTSNYLIRDAKLFDDLVEERRIMDEIYQLCNPKFHACGHFHKSLSVRTDTCMHRVLNIDELLQIDVIDGKIVQY